MNNDFDYISMHSIFVMTFLTKDGKEVDVADSEYDDKYIIEDLRFKKEHLNSLVAFANLEDGLKEIFLKNDSLEYIFKYINIGLEQNFIKIEELKGVSIFIGSNNPNFGLKERQSLEINLIDKIIETESWEEK